MSPRKQGFAQHPGAQSKAQHTPKWWWTPATTYIVVAGVLRLIWPEAFQLIGGLIACGFVFLSLKYNPVYAIQVMGHAIFPIRNTVVVKVDSKGRVTDDAGMVNDDDCEMSPEEMHRMSTAKRNWEKGVSLEELENRGELPF